MYLAIACFQFEDTSVHCQQSVDTEKFCSGYYRILSVLRTLKNVQLAMEQRMSVAQRAT